MVVTPVLHEVDTPAGTAHVHLERQNGARALLLLGHGAGGGLQSPDLLAASAAARDAGVAVGLVEQPWRVAGRRIAEAAPRLDAAWVAVTTALRDELPLLVGGRSTGARVACRTADEVDATAVLALAFPLVSPRGVSRLPELQAPRVPRQVLQGSRDPFGVPEEEPGVRVHVVAGADHAFKVRKADGRTAGEVQEELRRAVETWLAQTLT